MEWNRLEIKHIRAIEVTRIKQCYNNVPFVLWVDELIYLINLQVWKILKCSESEFEIERELNKL